MKQILYTIFHCSLALFISLTFNFIFGMEIEMWGKHSDTNVTEYKFYIPKPDKYKKYYPTPFIIKASVILIDHKQAVLQPELPDFFKNKYSAVPIKDFLECTPLIYFRCFKKSTPEAQVLTRENYQLLLTKIKEEHVMQSTMAEISYGSA